MSQPLSRRNPDVRRQLQPEEQCYCAGQIMNITQNTALFSLIGTFYGGNGSTTFGPAGFSQPDSGLHGPGQWAFQL